MDIVFATGSLLKPARIKLLQSGISIADELIIASNNTCSRTELVSGAIKQAQSFYGKNTYGRIISFGDGRWDLETAQALNIDFVGIGNKQLIGLGASTFFSDFNDPQLMAFMKNALEADSVKPGITAQPSASK